MLTKQINKSMRRRRPPPAPDLNQLTADQMTADQKVQQVNNQNQQQQQKQAPKGSPQEMAQATQIQQAQQQANTKGGIGTGAILTSSHLVCQVWFVVHTMLINEIKVNKD